MSVQTKRKNYQVTYSFVSVGYTDVSMPIITFFFFFLFYFFIIEYLIKVDTCICGDIVNELPLAQPTVSQHLKELKNAGLIKGEVEGNSVCYCIDETVIGKLKVYFAGMAASLEKKNNCC